MSISALKAWYQTNDLLNSWFFSDIPRILVMARKLQLLPPGFKKTDVPKMIASIDNSATFGQGLSLFIRVIVGLE